MKLSFKIALVTASSLISCTLLGRLPAQATTFAEGFSFIRLSDFSLTPQNPDADSIRDSTAFSVSEDSTVDANADGTLSFIIDENNDTVIDLDFQTQVTGNGDNYFGVGNTFSFTSSSFLIPENETLSFDFEVDLFLSNSVDSVEDGSVSNFSGVRFSLLDNSDESFLGGFLAQGNLTTNLLDFDNDFLFADATNNVSFEGFRTPSFGGNQEFGAITLTGDFSQTFTTDTEVRLEVSSLNLTCSQAPQTNDPCTKVPEPNNILTLIVGFIGLGLWKLTQSKSVENLAE